MKRLKPISLCLIMMMVLTCLSCKKDKKNEAAPAVLTSYNELVGKWGMNDGNVQTVDTIFVYSSAGNTYMTCPDANTDPNKDTIQITVTGSNYSIPSQVIYGLTYSIAGSGYLANNKLYLSYTAGPYNHPGLMYNRLN